MAARFRDFLQRLIDVGELERVTDEVDLRHVSARVAASPKALWFEHVPVVQAWGLLRQAGRLARETKSGKYQLKT